MKKKTKNTLLQVICTIIFILFLYQTKTIQNLSYIIFNNYETRFAQKHDFCTIESVGYLKYLKNKYTLIKRPKIINYIHTPNLSWVMINPKEIKNYSDYKILLNYPGKFINLKFNKSTKNIFQISKLNFYKDKTYKIEKLEISFREKFKFNQELNVELFIDTIKNKKRFIKKYEDFTINIDGNVEFFLNIDLHNSKFENESITFKVNELKKNEIDKVKFVALNKYDIKDYVVIDNFKNCYLIK